MGDNTASRSSNHWRLDSEQADHVALQLKIEWVVRCILDKDVQIQRLLNFVNRMDLFCSLFAEYRGEVEIISDETIQEMARALPFAFELAFYHPVTPAMRDSETYVRQRAELRLFGLPKPALDAVERCSAGLKYEYRQTVDHQFVVLSGASEEDNLTEHISALLDFVEGCPSVTQNHSVVTSRELCCVSESSGGGLGGVSLSSTLLKRLGSAGVSISFCLGTGIPYDLAAASE